MKSGVSPQKLRKYRWQTPNWASICTPVAPSLLISSGHSPRLGATIFVSGGTSSHLGGTALECSPVPLGLALPQFKIKQKIKSDILPEFPG